MEKKRDTKGRYNFTLSDDAIRNLDKLRAQAGLTRSGFFEMILLAPQMLESFRKEEKRA